MGRPSLRFLATALVVTGGLIAVVGVALIYLPAALVLAGAALAAAGLFAVEVDG